MSSTSSEFEIILFAAYLAEIQNKKQKKRRNDWVMNCKKIRSEGIRRSAFSLVRNERIVSLEDPYSFRNYLRMNEECFNIVLSKIQGTVNYSAAQCISLRDRLTITLRFLATGESFQSLSYHFRLERSIISKIVPGVLRAICESMHEQNMKLPATTNEWKEVENTFRNKWNFPNCCGAIDGKYINFLYSRPEGPFHNNSKGNNSIALMAIADGNYKFLAVKIGDNGSVFRNSLMSKYITNNTLNIPNNIPLPETNVCTPYVFVASDTFPLTSRLMTPFSYNDLSKEQKIYNNRVGHVRHVVENAFKILANRFRILLNPKKLTSIANVELITTTCCLLHNFLITQRGNCYSTLDEDEIVQHLESVDRNNSGESNTTQKAINLRNTFVDYFNYSENVLNIKL